MGAFDELLAELRKSANLGQGALARRAAIDPSSISRFEAGTRNPDREMVERLAEALGVDPETRDRLLAAAGYRPHDALSLTEDKVVRDLALFLNDQAVPGEVRERLRGLVWAALSLADGTPR